MAVRASTSGYAGVIKKLASQAADPNDPNTIKAPIGYGVFAQGLSGALAQKSLDDAYGGAYMDALHNEAENERAAVAATTSAQQKAAVIASLYPTLFNKVDSKGTVTEFNLANADPYGLINPVTANADAAIRRNADIATAHDTAASASGKLYDQGVKLDAADVNNDQGNPITGQAASYGVIPGAPSNKDRAALTTADASMKKADADMIDANQRIAVAKAGKADAAPTTSFVIPIPAANGQPGGMMTVKGKDANQVRAIAQASTQGTANGRTPQVQSLMSAAQRAGGQAVPTANGGLAVTLRGQTVHYNANGQRVQ